MTVGPIWNTGGTETEISVPVSVLGPGPKWAATWGQWHCHCIDWGLNIGFAFALLCQVRGMSLESCLLYFLFHFYGWTESENGLSTDLAAVKQKAHEIKYNKMLKHF